MGARGGDSVAPPPDVPVAVAAVRDVLDIDVGLRAAGAVVSTAFNVPLLAALTDKRGELRPLPLFLPPPDSLFTVAQA